MTDIAKEIQALRKLSVGELVERYRELWGKEPRCRNREHLWKRCAWRLQEIRFGGLSEVAKDRLEELIAEIDIPLTEKVRTVSGVLAKPRKPSDPPVGSTLTREWRGKPIQVRVVENGYEHEDVLYRTLTEAVRGITGSHWNPKIFFGLTPRKKAK